MDKELETGSLPEGDDNDAGQNEPETALDAIASSLSEEHGTEIEGYEPPSPDKDDDADEDEHDDNEDLGEGNEEDADPDADEDEEGDEEENEEYKMPEGLKDKKSQARFQNLVTLNKEKDTKIETLETNVTEFQSVINQSKMNPQEFSSMIKFSSQLKSNNPDDWKQALSFLDGIRSQVADALGEELPGIDMLDGHDDLKQKVEDMDLSREDALEIAKARNSTRRQQQQRSDRQSQQQSNQNSDQLQKVRTKAIDDIDSLTKGWASKDLSFPAKEKKLIAKAAEIAKDYPPHLWANTLSMYYDTLKAAPRAQNKGRQTPLRSGAAGGGTAEPKNSAEAVAAELGVSG